MTTPTKNLDCPQSALPVYSEVSLFVRTRQDSFAGMLSPCLLARGRGCSCSRSEPPYGGEVGGPLSRGSQPSGIHRRIIVELD